MATLALVRNALSRFGAPLIVLGAVALLGAGWIIWVNVAHLVAEHSSCKTWSTQSSAQLEVRGPAAHEECATVLEQQGWTAIPPDGPTGAHVVCQYAYNGTTYTVRDTGLGIVGSSVCATLAKNIDSLGGVGD